MPVCFGKSEEEEKDHSEWNKENVEGVVYV